MWHLSKDKTTVWKKDQVNRGEQVYREIRKTGEGKYEERVFTSFMLCCYPEQCQFKQAISSLVSKRVKQLLNS